MSSPDQAQQQQQQPGVSMFSNSTTVGVLWVSASNFAPALRNKTTGAVFTATAANWKLVFYCHWL